MAKKEGHVCIRHVYGTIGTLNGWMETALAHGIRPICVNVYRSGKNTTDIELAMSAIEICLTKDIDTFIIATSDSDFTGLAMRLREHGKHVIGFGREDASESLKNAFDVFVTAKARRTDMNAQTVKETDPNARANTHKDAQTTNEPTVTHTNKQKPNEPKQKASKPEQKTTESTNESKQKTSAPATILTPEQHLAVECMRRNKGRATVGDVAKYVYDEYGRDHIRQLGHRNFTAFLKTIPNVTLNETNAMVELTDTEPEKPAPRHMRTS